LGNAKFLTLTHTERCPDATTAPCITKDWRKLTVNKVYKRMPGAVTDRSKAVDVARSESF